jgi:hypothetical protein
VSLASPITPPTSEIQLHTTNARDPREEVDAANLAKKQGAGKEKERHSDSPTLQSPDALLLLEERKSEEEGGQGV